MMMLLRGGVKLLRGGVKLMRRWRRERWQKPHKTEQTEAPTCDLPSEMLSDST